MSKEEFKAFTERMTAAVSKAVKEAIQDHFRHGDYVVVMQNGKLTKLYPPKKPQ